ncbi:MAG: BatD family protein [Myxococcales bacterium]|nr:BatD family protein [Myxococcales bacterium]
MRRSALALPALACLLLATAARAEVQVDVQVDRKQISANDQLTVRIEVQSEGGSSPDVQLPDFAGFQVVGRQVQRPMSFSFNFGSRAVMRSSTIYIFRLQPTQVGKLSIGPVQVKQDGQLYTTQPVAITVAGHPGAAAPQGQADPNAPIAPGAPAAAASAQPQGADGASVDATAFLRTVVDKAEPYVGEQVNVTVYLYLRQRLQSAPQVEKEPGVDGFWTRDLLGPDHKLQGRRQAVGNTLYTVYTLRHFAAFPLREGELQIGPMKIVIDTSSVFDLFGGGRRQSSLARTGVPVTLNVKALPGDGRPPGPVAVGQYELAAELDRRQAVAGDAVTLTARVRGRGNIQTVSIDTPRVAGLEFLDPQTKDLVETPNDVVMGTREQRWLIVAREPGIHRIGPLTLATFDPKQERYKLIQSAPLNLEVVGTASAAAPAAQQPSPTPEPKPEAHSTEDQHQWAPVRTRSGLRRAPELLAEGGFFGWALALPPLLFLLVAGSGLWRRRRAARPRSPRERADAAAQEHLGQARTSARAGDAAAFHGAAERAVQAKLEALLGEPVTSLTRPELERLLEARAMSRPLTNRTLEALQQADFARFASGSAGGEGLDSEVTRLTQLLGELDRFEPGAEEAR